MSDTLSLTLPKLGARTRRRFRKPRKPTFWEMYDLFWCGFSCLFAVLNWLHHHPVHAMLYGALAAWWLYVYQHDRQGKRAPLRATLGLLPVIALLWVLPAHS